MKINDDLYVILLPLNFGGHTSQLNVSVVLDPEHGATLVDAGLPGQEKLIEEGLAEAGIGLSDLKQIILTHHDLDHVGSLHALKEETGAVTMASEVETPYIQGEKRGAKLPPPEKLDEMPQLKAVVESMRPTPIDRQLAYGDVLDIAGGIRVVGTPGHTPGHISLFLERTKTLIAADALTSDNGTLHGPSQQNTPDMETAIASVRSLAELDVEAILCYHGGLVTDDANGQLRRVAGELR